MLPIELRGLREANERQAWRNVQLKLGLLTSDELAISYDSDTDCGRTKPGDHAPDPYQVLLARRRHPCTGDQLRQDLQLCQTGLAAQFGQASAVFKVDVVAWALWFHTRSEEAPGDRDQYGRFARCRSALSPELDWLPVLDLIVGALREFICAAAERSGLRNEHVVPWPLGKRFAISLSHDVDHAESRSLRAGVRKLAAAGLAGARRDVPTMRRRARDAVGVSSRSGPSPYWLMPHFARLERERGFRATYFILPGASRTLVEGDRKVRRYRVNDPKVRGLLDELHSMGAELGLHTTFDAHETDGGIGRDAALLRESLPATAELRGARSHYLRLWVPETWQREASTGLLWDSTIGWDEGWGFRAGTTLPFRVDAQFDGTEPFWQLGLTVMDSALEQPTVLGAVTDALDVCRAHGGCAVLLVHPNPLDNSTAQEHLVLYEKILDIVQGHPDAWVATSSEIIEAMQQHERRVCQADA